MTITATISVITLWPIAVGYGGINAFAPSLLLLCHPPSLLGQLHKHNMHLGEKFDAKITNRMNGKDLGYDEFTGRFFEV